MIKKKNRGLLHWLTNNLTYDKKYLFAGFVRGIGFFILWFYLLFSDSPSNFFDQSAAKQY